MVISVEDKIEKVLGEEGLYSSTCLGGDGCQCSKPT